jgi:Zn-dependent peptidase ImmA (M78 family)
MATMTDEQKRVAETTATEVLNDTFGSIDIVEFPLDLSAVADKYGLTIKTGTFEDQTVSGAYDRAGAAIFVDSDESLERQRFTIAHEIGHDRLHKDVKTDLLYRKAIWQFADGTHPKNETQANWFAACLLMPEEAMRRMWKVTQDIEQLCTFFGVSKTALSYRLKDLDLVGK